MFQQSKREVEKSKVKYLLIEKERIPEEVAFKLFERGYHYAKLFKDPSGDNPVRQAFNQIKQWREIE